jgi:hypothetical protein
MMHRTLTAAALMRCANWHQAQAMREINERAARFHREQARLNYQFATIDDDALRESAIAVYVERLWRGDFT